MSSNTASDPVAHLLRTASDEQLVRELFPDVQRIAGSVIGFADSDLLLTAAHDALLNVVRYRATFDGRSRGSTWLYTLTVRAARRAAGREHAAIGRWLPFDDALDPGAQRASREPHGGPTEPGCARLEICADPLAKIEAMQLLEERVPQVKWREIWLLYHDPESRLDHEAIGARRGYTAGSVAVILSRVRRALSETPQSEA